MRHFGAIGLGGQIVARPDGGIAATRIARDLVAIASASDSAAKISEEKRKRRTAQRITTSSGIRAVAATFH